MLKFNKKILFGFIFLGGFCYTIISLVEFKGSSENEFEKYITGTKVKSFVTIFTIYYKLGKSKHKAKSYDVWADNFFEIVSSPIVVFTDQLSLPRLLNKSSELNLSASFYVTKDVWTLMKMLEKERNKEYIQKYKTKQHQIDPEKRIHSPDLYAIWNLKHFIGKLVSQFNPYKSDFFIFTDIGGWRSKNFSNWPYVDLVKNLSIYLNDTCLYSQVYTGSIGGGFIAGSKTAFQKVSSKFYEIHDKWFEKDIFVGKEQNIMNALAFKEYPSYVMRLRSWRHTCLNRYSRWFFYESFLQYNPKCSFNLKNSILKSK